MPDVPPEIAAAFALMPPLEKDQLVGYYVTWVVAQRGSVAAAARALGIERSSLQRTLKRFRR